MARKASRKLTPKSQDKSLGRFPVWDLSDLYPGTNSNALLSNFSTVEKKARAFHKKY